MPRTSKHHRLDARCALAYSPRQVVAYRRRVPGETSSTRVRRVVGHVLVGTVACGQIACLLELLGAPLTPTIVLGAEAVLVPAFALLAAREPREARAWALGGFVMWSIWGALYFGAAAVTQPPNARTFDDAILERLPLVPAFASVYVGVHTFSMIPYCFVPHEKLRRYALGNLLILLLSAIVWVTLPVRLDRPPFAADTPGFGAWVLRLVYAGDPTTNCFPSAHCSVATYAAIGMRAAPRPFFVWSVVSAVAICVSTVLTRQHYVADVLGGAVIASLLAWATRESPRGAT